MRVPFKVRHPWQSFAYWYGSRFGWKLRYDGTQVIGSLAHPWKLLRSKLKQRT